MQKLYYNYFWFSLSQSYTIYNIIVLLPSGAVWNLQICAQNISYIRIDNLDKWKYKPNILFHLTHVGPYPYSISPEMFNFTSVIFAVPYFYYVYVIKSIELWKKVDFEFQFNKFSFQFFIFSSNFPSNCWLSFVDVSFAPLYLQY